VECLAVLIQKLDTDFGPDQTILYFLLNDLFHASLQIVRKVLNHCEDFLHCCSLDDLFNEVVVRFVRVGIDVNFHRDASSAAAALIIRAGACIASRYQNGIRT